MGPLDTAIYWIEYVLRHKGADQLQVASLDLYWFQYYLLDIYSVLGVTVFTIYFIVKRLFAVFYKADKKVKMSSSGIKRE